jgi:uncharacterized protein (DUF433 family)/DNA-binding transcriptional MerR regulator
MVEKTGMETGGAYSAERAAALSGVPKRTVYHWAKNGHLVPSVSQSPLLWSYTDLLALRTIYWLRRPKKAFDRTVPATSMAKVRRALEELRRLDLDLLEGGRPTVVVTVKGEIAVNVQAFPLQRAEDGQYIERDLVDVLGPFEGLEGMRGPDLAWPRPTVQILPRKISGAPHVAGTRLPTQSIFALARRGFDLERLTKIYPFIDRQALGDSIELEEQLQNNLSLLKAA